MFPRIFQRRKNLPLRNTSEGAFAGAIDHSRILALLLPLSLWCIIAMLLSLPGEQPEYALFHAGQKAPRSVYAADNFSVVDAEATKAEKERARLLQLDYYRITDAESRRIRQDFNAFFRAVDQRCEAAKRFEQFLPGKEISGVLAENLDKRLLAILLNFRNGQSAGFARFNRKLADLNAAGILKIADKKAFQLGQNIRIVDSLERERYPVSIIDVKDAGECADELAAEVARGIADPADNTTITKQLAGIFVQLLGDGNLEFDRGKTRKARDNAASHVTDVLRHYEEGALLVREGEEVTPAIADALVADAKARAEMRTSTRDNLLRWGTSALWSLLLVILAWAYMHQIHPDVLKSNRKLFLAGVIVVLSLAIDYLAIRSSFWLVNYKYSSPEAITGIVPIALPAVLLGAMLGTRVAIAGGFLVTMVCAMMLDRVGGMAIAGMLLCLVGALAVRNASNYRAYFLRIFFTVTPMAMVFGAIISLDSLNGETLLVRVIPSAFLNGLFTSVLALFLTFFFELAFNVDTNMSLMVLCDYNHPLLERLKREAPGTFFHSLMCATLSEDAARTIGANSLKAKAEALFHDIGKLAKPHYFTENNLYTGNQHLDLNPQVSSIIIRDHVREGLELARRYKLSHSVRNAICQHHGNDLVHFFYHQAVEAGRESGTPVTEAQYRYGGELPREKEVVIVCLADACEAACRSLEKSSAGKIQALVREIFLKRYRDGMLDEAEITVAELSEVEQSFTNTLVAMRHSRVACPEEQRNDENNLFVAR
ncbi:MAG: HDIG domain-containing protein [Victivallaceae bacterium]|nr:HDIG domain-containing protein [Victivallaceae bacterium]